MNIRLRLTLWYTAIFSLILVIFSLAVYVGLTRSLMNTVDSHLQREIGEMLGNLEFEDDGGIELDYTPEEGVYWRILNTNGQPLVDPGFFENTPFTADVTDLNRTITEYTILPTGVPIRLYTAPFIIENRGAGVIQVAESYLHVQEVQNQLLFLLGIGIPFTLLAASAGGWFLAASALDPIDRITRTAQRISARDLHQRLNLSLPNDEVGRLASTFDQMLERLDNAFEQQRRFIADASHEMKTPLTIIKGDVEVALNRPRSQDYYRKTLEMVNGTTDRLIALVQELLLLARADGYQTLLELETFNLAQVLSAEMRRLRPKAVSQDITLILDTPDILLIEADRDKIQRLFLNLVDNAIKYSRPGDNVTVQAKVTAGQAHIQVADTGPGIPAEHLPHLFERFYRADKARARVEDTNGNSSGAGLGLSIVQWLVQAHNGRIEVESIPEQGTIFSVWLPLTQTTPISIGESS